MKRSNEPIKLLIWSGVGKFRSVSACLCSRISPPRLLWWDIYQVADVWNSLSALWDFSALSAVDSFSGAYLNSGALFFSCSSAFLLLDSWRLNTHTHTCSVQTHTRPQIQESQCFHRTILTLSALLRSARSKAICPPLPILHSLSVNPSSLFFSLKDEKKKKSHPPFSRGMTIPSPILPQIHSPTVFGTSNLLSSYSHSHSIQPF